MAHPARLSTMQHSVAYNNLVILLMVIKSLLVAVSPLLYKKDLPDQATRDAQDFH
jgi:hypothetical protein